MMMISSREEISATPQRWVPMLLAVLVMLAGLAGLITEAWGYALFILATLLLLTGLGSFATFTLTKAFDTDGLRNLFANAFWLGGWCYVLAVAALAGAFTHDTILGHMGLKWIIFGPAILAALIILDWGLYRIVVGKNQPTWQRYNTHISRSAIDEVAMRQTLLDEVILHRTLFRVSRFRWLRHQLIFWGFGLMFAVEIVAVVFREALPAFGIASPWHDTTHPLRLAFDAAYDLTGLMILVGCIMALYFRYRVNGQPDQKYTDTPTAVFLLIVVVSGFVVEGIRLAGVPESAQHVASPVGWVFALAIGDASAASRAWYEGLWLFHVLGSCAFIAYVPVKRLVHSCATPIGRLMNSQKGMLAAKKHASLRGLMRQKGGE